MMKKPSRGQIIFFSATTSIGSLLAYDRYQAKAIRTRFIEEARVLAEQPIGVTEEPRRLTVFLSANSTDQGYKMKRAFERYVKPIWDAAALDYEVYEGWEWFTDVRERVVQELKKKGDGEINAIKRLNEDEDGGNGFVAFGRPAFKGILAGYQDYQSSTEKMLKEGDNNEIIPLKSLNSSSKKDENSRTWWEWFWGSGSSTKQDDEKIDTPVLAHSHFDMDAYPTSENKLPSVGYIPYVVPRWFKRVYSWFDERNYVQQVGGSALTIALGKRIEISQLFPGDVNFHVEKNERQEKIKKNNEANETPREESEEEIQQVIIKEEALSNVEMYYSKPNNK